MQPARRLSSAFPTLPTSEPEAVTRRVLGAPQRGCPRCAGRDRNERKGSDHGEQSEDHHGGRAPSRLLLTRCRPGEIRCLRWCEVKPDRLTLIDAKTGPKYALLGEAARELLNGLAETASGEWVFPGKSGDEPLTKGDLYSFWIKARDAAGIVADAWLHDLRHAHASHAVMNGESLHVAGRLLGHRRASTTNRYVHLDDATLSQAVGRVALAIQRKLGYGVDQRKPDKRDFCRGEQR